MKPFVLYCCTYRKDLNRLALLWRSIKRYNKDEIPFYISVPTEDVDLFREKFGSERLQVIDEKDILRANPRLNLEKIYFSNEGKKQQQIIKSEFWRLGIAENYLVLDADCLFIRPFGFSDFLVDGGLPYSVIHEGKTLLQFTARFGPKRVREYWKKDRTPIQRSLSRPGVPYDYGYAPFLWSSKVWKSLDNEFLTPNGLTLWDVICETSSEFTWYGESLMKYRAIPIWPRGELFKHYHYEPELWFDKKNGITEELLAKDYLGVVYQSNWNTSLDFGPSDKSNLSRFARQTRRAFKWLRFHLLKR